MVEFINMKPFSDIDHAINTDNEHYDLHSNAEFYKLELNAFTNSLELIWKFPADVSILFNQKEIILGKEYKLVNYNDQKLKHILNLKLKFTEIKNLYITKRDNIFPYDQILTLEDIYYYKEFRPDKIEFEFANSMKIVIFCKKIEFIREINKEILNEIV